MLQEKIPEANYETNYEFIIAEKKKDESLTNLTLSQWYRGLARHHVSRARRRVWTFLRRGDAP